MPEFGQHAIFILAAYGVTFIAVCALALVIVADDRKQRRLLAELERKGIRRRSAAAPSKPQAAKREAAKPEAAKPQARKPARKRSS
ncbi:MAG: heme exporter protein CcmD [Methyloceanibacter sp.]|uniref:heme exporter protein CcmD n=1 Tax=Methyloceanibacter sp. TaxID=1965321 RepID=UPI003D9B9130